MVKVTLNGITLAESTETVVVENNHYFPPSAVNESVFSHSETQWVPLPIIYRHFLSMIDA